MPKDPSAPGWLLVQTRASGLAAAERNLARQGIETFCPRLNVTRRRRGRFVPQREPLFPGYLFAAPRTPEAHRAIRSTLGVARVVAFGEHPARVPEALIALLKMRCDPDGALVPEAVAPGDEVRLIGGPFADFAARVERLDTDSRVWVLLDLLGTRTRTRLPLDQLRRSGP